MVTHSNQSNYLTIRKAVKTIRVSCEKFTKAVTNITEDYSK
jgi:hypothetical protein